MYKKPFIEKLLSEFYFLIEEDYNDIRIAAPTWEIDIIFKSTKHKRIISFHKTGDDIIVISISKLSNLFFRKEIYLHELYRDNDIHCLSLDEENYANKLSKYAAFMKDKLMPIVRGERWFDERDFQ